MCSFSFANIIGLCALLECNDYSGRQNHMSRGGVGKISYSFPSTFSDLYTLASLVPDAKLFISFREVGGSSHRVFNITNHLLQRCARHPVMASRIWRSSRKTYDHVADRVTWLVSGPRSLEGASAGSCPCVQWCVWCATARHVVRKDNSRHQFMASQGISSGVQCCRKNYF